MKTHLLETRIISLLLISLILDFGVHAGIMHEHSLAKESYKNEAVCMRQYNTADGVQDNYSEKKIKEERDKKTEEYDQEKEVIKAVFQVWNPEKGSPAKGADWEKIESVKEKIENTSNMTLKENAAAVIETVEKTLKEREDAASKAVALVWKKGKLTDKATRVSIEEADAIVKNLHEGDVKRNLAEKIANAMSALEEKERIEQERKQENAREEAKQMEQADVITAPEGGLLLQHIYNHETYNTLNTQQQRDAYAAFQAMLTGTDRSTDGVDFYTGKMSLADIQELMGVAGDELLNAYGEPAIYYVENDDGTVTLSAIPADMCSAYEKSQYYNEYIDSIAYQLISANMTEWDAFEAISRWIIDNMDYTANASYAQAGLAINEHTGNCEGYSQILKEMLNAVGINAYTVVGNADGPHMWNRVMIEGNWYWVDITWRDTAEDESYAYSGGLWENHTVNDDFYRG